MEKSFTKSFDGKKYCYKFNGKTFRSSTKNYKYGCIATSRETGISFAVSLGNREETTLNSMHHRYAHYCDMEVVEIEKEMSYATIEVEVFSDDKIANLYELETLDVDGKLNRRGIFVSKYSAESVADHMVHLGIIKSYTIINKYLFF